MNGICCTPSEGYFETTVKYSLLLWNRFIAYDSTTFTVLVQDYTQEEEESTNCAALEESKNTKGLNVFRENCKVKHRPLCMRSASNCYDFDEDNGYQSSECYNIQFDSNRGKRKSHKKKKT